DLYAGHGFADSGNYNSLAKTTVRQTAFIAGTAKGQLMATVRCKVKDVARKYRIDFGQGQEVITGTELADTEIGPFSVGGRDIVPFTIRLAEPEYAEEDVGLELDAVEMRRVGSTT